MPIKMIDSNYILIEVSYHLVRLNVENDNNSLFNFSFAYIET